MNLRCILAALGICATWMSTNATAHPACQAPSMQTLSVGQAVICLEREPALAPSDAVLTEWIVRSAAIVSQYYGMFPARTLRLTLRAMSGSGVGGGRTMSEPDLHIEMRVGTSASRDSLREDWVLVHEMVHLALPEVGRRHNWLAEGLATYVEGVARVQAGNRSVEDFWAEARHSMPAGLARSGEGGLDESSSWGRTYWGGALFCLQADLAIRQGTGNRQGLNAALRAILHDTGGYAHERSIEEVLRLGDQATATHALTELYQQDKSTPQGMDLEALWKSLGVPQDPLRMPFDDAAPLAALRRAIAEPANAKP